VSEGDTEDRGHDDSDDGADSNLAQPPAVKRSAHGAMLSTHLAEASSTCESISDGGGHGPVRST
jgi:hypothetical protein